MQHELKQSILASYLIGGPIGIVTIISAIYMPVLLTGEGLFTLVIMQVYRLSIIGLVVAFLIALGVGGKLAYHNIKSGKSIFTTSFKYSALVNLMIWATFCLIVGFTVAEDPFLMMIPPLIAGIVCTVLTTCSLGLLVAYKIKRIVLQNR